MSFPEGEKISQVKQTELLFLNVYGAFCSHLLKNTNCFHAAPLWVKG